MLAPRRGRPRRLGILLAALAALVAGTASLRTRALRPRPTRRARGALVLERHVLVRAPVEEVFATFAGFESFPAFMKHVLDVRPMTARLSRWKVGGRMGSSVEWDVERVRCAPHSEVAWKTHEGAPVHHEGVARFTPADAGQATRVAVEVAYAPAKEGGPALAAVLGDDPAAALEEDLRRFASLVEEHRGQLAAHRSPPAHAAFEGSRR